MERFRDAKGRFISGLPPKVDKWATEEEFRAAAKAEEDPEITLAKQRRSLLIGLDPLFVDSIKLKVA